MVGHCSNCGAEVSYQETDLEWSSLGELGSALMPPPCSECGSIVVSTEPEKPLIDIPGPGGRAVVEIETIMSVKAYGGMGYHFLQEIRAAIAAVVEKAIAQEREACAVVADRETPTVECVEREMAQDIARYIRERKL